jgi:hypothetical protein
MGQFQLAVFAVFFSICGWAHQNQKVEIKHNQLTINNHPQPQLFGAEVQYFRLRGGYGRNIPRKTVIDLWNKALDRVVEAKMNAISFYIPWDFHEYAEGKFDFTGTADEDGDGNPDYPSRDVITFFKLAKEHGINRIMVRPGPYINAEWGFLGFGAIPEWFHKKYPESHMMSSTGLRTKLFDYLNPQFLKSTRTWFETLYNEVLKFNLGAGKQIVFLQVDNETNFQWQSIFDQDYSPHSISRYQDFLKSSYGNIEKLNSTHNRGWSSFSQARPPTEPGLNIPEDQDWYRFNDLTIFTYLNKIRKIWEDLGVREPQVLFTLAESYNAPEHGLLPNYIYRNAANTTGLMTVNLYPKTFETQDNTLLNFPFKADLDVKAATVANDLYYGSRQEWSMGPEIQAGWWKGINVSRESRQQTYLTVIGHGLKSFFLYYFNEGQNYGIEWGKNQVLPLFDNLKKEMNLITVPTDQLSEDFWNELQNRANKSIVSGLDVKGLIKDNNQREENLFFDSPLDGNANPRDHFAELKLIGERVIQPYQDFLARAVEVNDDVGMVKDTYNHVPSPNRDINSLWASAEWSGGLLGYLMNSDVNPHILIGDLTPEKYFSKSKVLFHIDTDLNSPRTLKILRDGFNRGQGIVNFLGSELSRHVGYDFSTSRAANEDSEKLRAYITSDGRLGTKGQRGVQAIDFSSTGPVFAYDLASAPAKNCEGVLYYQDQVVGYKCRGNKGSFIQVGALIFNDYNSSNYAGLQEPVQRKQFMQAILAESNYSPLMKFSSDAKLTVAFARRDLEKKLIWITVKTGLQGPQKIKLQMAAKLLSKGLGMPKEIKITDLLSQEAQTSSFSKLTTEGFDVALKADGSTVFVIEGK